SLMRVGLLVCGAFRHPGLIPCTRMFQAFQSGTRSLLLRLFFGTSIAACQAFAKRPDLTVEKLLVVGSFFARQPVLSRRLSAALQKFLQCRFAIGIRDMRAPSFQRKLKEQPPKQVSGGVQPRIEKNCAHNGFKRVRNDCSLLASPGFLLASA